jgi:S1-C subfamily serine protease
MPDTTSETKRQIDRVTRAGLAVLVVILCVLPTTGASQAMAVLRITVMLADADQRPVPVPRHALLVSDNPPTAAPRRVVTGRDGTAAVRVPPGNYTVESDQPLVFQGRQYVWTQTLDVAAAADTVLALTAANSESGPVTAGSAPPTGRAADLADALILWQDSVVGLWTPTTTASGVVVDARGLVATNQQVIGASTAVEVQITPETKVAGRVLAADRANDVAVLWVDPAALAKITPVPLGCAPATAAPLANGQEVVALGVPPGGSLRSTYGAVSRVGSRAMIADLSLPRGSAGGPVFAAGGRLVGLTSFIAEKEGTPDEESRVVRADAICDTVASATAKMTGAPPAGARLPVEPTLAVAENALAAATKGRAGSLSPYAATSAGFDIAFLTPVQVYAGLRGTMDFANWHDYVAGLPPVLLVRVTPKREEGFWTKVARGLVLTQGVALPPITRFVSGFTRLRALCGPTEVTPIHPFLLERRVSETDAIREGLYVFDPAALGPHCGTVRLELFSDKTPAIADAAAIDPAVLQRIWQDFAPYRALK